MTCSAAIAHRAVRQLRRAIPVVAALTIALTATGPVAQPAHAAYAPRVVIVVGPTHDSTAEYLRHARAYARRARALGATVETVFHPHATWRRVMAAAQGANVFIYLGHGNGWPSIYAPWQGNTKDGLGLNPRDGASRSQVRYYGENWIRSHLRFAPGAVVLLNRLCYASGNGGPGVGGRSWEKAVKRVDNFASGFIDAGASTVIADGVTTLGFEIARLFGPSRRILDTWRTDPDAHGHARAYPSRRSPGYTLHIDPERPRGGFYRSLVTKAPVRTTWIRTPALWGTARVGLALRSSVGTDSRAVTRLGAGTRYVVHDALVRDARGRTWARVMTRDGRSGYVAAWATGFAGTAASRMAIVLRAKPSVVAGRLGVVRDGARVTVMRSARDRFDRAWLRVRTPHGRVGWMAAWLMQP